MKSKVSIENLRHRINVDFILQMEQFQIDSSDTVVVTGLNGSGKSTFLRLLSGLLIPEQGQISYVLNENSLRRRDWHKHLSYLPENFMLPPKSSVEENVLYFLRLMGFSSSQAKASLVAMTREWGLEKFWRKRGYELSVGMQQKVKIALVFAKAAPFIVMDEPLESLDDVSRKLVCTRIRQHSERGGITLFSVVGSDPLGSLQPCRTIQFSEGTGTEVSSRKNNVVHRLS